ncbi:MAG TPA: DNA mismatch repair protein MutS [Polyangiaceae bacterium]|nr:DNA mismatch repair protein MutS [Polyangiaceae bacterium]
MSSAKRPETEASQQGQTQTKQGLPPELHGVLKIYSDRAAKRFAEAEGLGARSRLVSNLRGTSFGAFVICGVSALVRAHGAPWGWAALALFGVFLVLVTWHNRVIELEQMALRWVQVNRDAITRNGSRFRDLPNDGTKFSNPLHPYADDLDLFGKASLFQRMCTAHTTFGQQRLAAYLMNRAPMTEIRQRQTAASELRDALDWRQELEALALAVVDPLGQAPSVDGTSPKDKVDSKSQASRAVALDTEPLLSWAEGAPGLSKQLSVVIVAWLLPILSVSVMIAAGIRGWGPSSWVPLLILNALFLLTCRVYVSSVFAAISTSQGVFLRFGPMLRLLEELRPEAPMLRDLQAELGSVDGEPPSVSMRQFARIVSWFELRHNGLAHPLINTVLLWDVHCVLRLEAWQRRVGKRLRRWFVALGELEALASLASFAHDNQDYALPVISDEQAHFRAEGLAHPLLSSANRVANDVELTGPGNALLVTGSNMSGKSTLLRSMGINAVLALSGSVVCAKQLAISTLAVRTSMRIRDSLDQGVSHFYAELRKLKGVLDATQGAVPVLFLLDEVLHGTNSRERQIGARWLLSEMLRRGGLGAVSTHDSGLCELPPHLMDHVTQVHLRELAQEGELVFDYKLRPGPVQTGNALRLMRSLGLEVPLD